MGSEKMVAVFEVLTRPRPLASAQTHLFSQNQEHGNN
jgi:hypothetical protein